MNDYTKGILTGASLILCFFMLVSAKSQSKNLGEITVDSITVLNKQGEPSILMDADSSGYIFTRNADGEMAVAIGSYKDGAGLISLFQDGGKDAVNLGSAISQGGIITKNTDGEITAVLGMRNGTGVVSTFNADGTAAAGLGAFDGTGVISTFNADGDPTTLIGTKDGVGYLSTFNANGKISAFLSKGFLKTFNKHEVETGHFGTNDDNDGVALLSDRYGDIGWTASGKK